VFGGRSRSSTICMVKAVGRSWPAVEEREREQGERTVRVSE
jgi:hypothetical protein